ncbi:MAG: VTT domain-containing protein, partial [Pseudomonadales bacterium]
VAGAGGARWVAAHLRRDWQPGEFARRVVELLRSRGDLFTQIALRVLPGFPHSVVNFAGGVLHLPLPGFLLAAVIGLSVKWAVYASAAYGISDSLAAGTAMRFETLLPLVILTGLLLLGGWYRRRLVKHL